MKYILLAIILFSCTKEPLHQCGTVMAKELKHIGGPAGSQKIYLYVQHDSIINKVAIGLLDYERYQVGDTYCASTY